ncbi:MAG: ankyrin repeat domain-containing protein [Rickettsia endosymbiont of Glossina mortisans submortisans]|nr:ankyrin repeat domain-containing protein [Rickettsia endosymbiont of Glossina mortisans submortisans]
MIRILLSITGQDGDSLVQDSQTIDITAELHKIFFQEILNGNRQTVEALMTITQNHKLVIDVNKSNMTDEYSGTALLMAIDLQDADMVELLLTHPNIDLNISFTYYRDANINGDIYTVHPFLEALSSNDRIIHLFLKDFDKNKIDILEVDKHGQVFVDNSNEIIIKRNQNSESALMIAIKYGDIDILRRLINALKIKLTNDHFKQYLNYVEPFEGNNVLTLAGRQGNKVIVQELIGLKGEDGVPLININHQDFFGNRVQHYFTDDEEIQYEFRQHATQDLSTKTLKNIITNPQSTHYADEEVKKCIAALQSQFQDQLTEQHIGQSVEAIHNYLDKLQNDRIFCLDSFGHRTISIQCRTTTNVESVSRNISVEIVPKVVKHLLQRFDGTMREVMHLAWLMIKYREKTDNSQNFNFTIDLIKNLTQAAFEYTKDDVKELNVETMKQACSKGICTVLISCAMPTVRLVNYDEGEKAPGYFAQNPERVREYLQATTEYIQCEIFTAEFRNKWQKMLNEFCPNPTNDDKIVWDNELNKLNVILDQSEFLDVWPDIMEIIKDLMNNENNWNPSNITQILKKQYSSVIMIHQKLKIFYKSNHNYCKQ